MAQLADHNLVRLLDVFEHPPLKKVCPQDATAAAMAAEAYMNVYAWKYTISEHSPVLRRHIQTALELLNYSLSLEPRHVLALHLKVHLLETQPLNSTSGPDATLREGEAAADSLKALAQFPELPGHLVHMPCHVFIRTGRWQDAVEVCMADCLCRVRACVIIFITTVPGCFSTCLIKQASVCAPDSQPTADQCCRS